MFSKTTVRLAAATGAFIGLAIGMPLGAAISHADPAQPAPVISEDDPGWNCTRDGNRICGPDNADGVDPGCYNEIGELVAAWPCHVVVDPKTGEGDVYEGLA
jgi:hypothetical protein